MIWDILSWTKCFRYKVVYDTITLTHGQSGCNFYIQTYPGTNHDTAWVAFTSRSYTTYSLSFEWGIRFRFLRWFLLLPLLYRLLRCHLLKDESVNPYGERLVSPLPPMKMNDTFSIFVKVIQKKKPILSVLWSSSFGGVWVVDALGKWDRHHSRVSPRFTVMESDAYEHQRKSHYLGQLQE